MLGAYVDGQLVQSGISFPGKGVQVVLQVKGNGTSGPGSSVLDVDYVRVYAMA